MSRRHDEEGGRMGGGHHDVLALALARLVASYVGTHCEA